MRVLRRCLLPVGFIVACSLVTTLLVLLAHRGGAALHALIWGTCLACVAATLAAELVESAPCHPHGARTHRPVMDTFRLRG